MPAAVKCDLDVAVAPVKHDLDTVKFLELYIQAPVRCDCCFHSQTVGVYMTACAHLA